MHKPQIASQGQCQGRRSTGSRRPKSRNSQGPSGLRAFLRKAKAFRPLDSRNALLCNVLLVTDYFFIGAQLTPFCLSWLPPILSSSTVFLVCQRSFDQLLVDLPFSSSIAATERPAALDDFCTDPILPIQSVVYFFISEDVSTDISPVRYHLSDSCPRQRDR